MRLMPDELKSIIPKLYETEEILLSEKVVYARYYEVRSGWEWFLCEYDPDAKIGFGLVKGFEEEYGYFSLIEMEAIGTIIRDELFQPMKFKQMK